MLYIKERPKCRLEIEKLLADGHDLLEIKFGNSKGLFFSDGLRKQARKMLQEKNENWRNYRTFGWEWS